MKKKILIVVKTYPTRSKKYQELVCTAGLDEKGNWYRIYPIPTKTLKEYEWLKKYTWIEAEIDKNYKDPRIESYKINVSSVKLLNIISTDKNWQYRKDIVFRAKVFYNLKEIIIKSKKNELSLCLFKPKTYLNVYFEKIKRENYSEKEKKEFINANLNLFEHTSCEVEFNAMPSLPYRIKLEFKDNNGEKSKMTILDWEINQLYWNLKNSKKDDEKIKADIKNKLFWMIKNRDLYLILGTMRQMHGWTKNPFTIIGLFYPPKVKNYTKPLFDI